MNTTRTASDLKPIAMTATKAANYAFAHVSGLPAYAGADLATIRDQAAVLLRGMISRGIFIITD